jgi:hypothetical protein
MQISEGSLRCGAARSRAQIVGAVWRVSAARQPNLDQWVARVLIPDESNRRHLIKASGSKDFPGQLGIPNLSASRSAVRSTMLMSRALDLARG